MWKRHRIRFVDIDTMNEILFDCRNKVIYEGAYEETKGDYIEGNAFIEDKTVKFQVTTRYKGVVATYIAFKDGRATDYMETTTGLNAFIDLSHYWKVPRIKAIDSATPLIGYDDSPNRNNHKHIAWGYDLNSAYSAAMLKGWIDVSKVPSRGFINPITQIGFDYNDDGMLELKHSGYCEWIFDKCETPEGVKQFIFKWYKMKEEAVAAGDILQKNKAKSMLNYVVGYFQKVNPWLRAWVVCSCNEYIQNLLDEDSLFWNTDAIVSLRRRPDLEANLGTGIGQWKLEHEGEVAYVNNCYQWNGQTPTYRGVAKSWFKEGWDILKDELPVVGNAYEFNKEELRLEATEYASSELI